MSKKSKARFEARFGDLAPVVLSIRGKLRKRLTDAFARPEFATKLEEAMFEEMQLVDLGVAADAAWDFLWLSLNATNGMQCEKLRKTRRRIAAIKQRCAATAQAKSILPPAPMKSAGLPRRPPRPRVYQSTSRAGGFYDSREWLEVRYRVLRKHGPVCAICGRTRQDGVKLHVDHIKPRSKFPELELQESNLQVLCDQCNIGKGNTDSIDWREPVHVPGPQARRVTEQGRQLDADFHRAIGSDDKTH